MSRWTQTGILCCFYLSDFLYYILIVFIFLNCWFYLFWTPESIKENTSATQFYERPLTVKIKI